MENKDFEIVEPTTENTNIDASNEVEQEDFSFINPNSIQHETKFETKPTTFLKDSLKRFSKNKSSVVAAVILGLLLVLSIVVPIVDTNDIKSAHPYYTYLEPKLFPAGTGFWDGTKKYKNIPYDVETGYPDPDTFKSSAVRNLKVGEEAFTDTASKYGVGGYVNFYVTPAKEKVVEVSGHQDIEIASTSGSLISPTFSGDLLTSDTNTVEIVFGTSEVRYSKLLPYTLSLNYSETIDSEKVNKSIVLYENLTNYDSLTFNISDVLNSKDSSKATYSDVQFVFTITNDDLLYNGHILIKSVKFTTSNTSTAFINSLNSISFDDANKMVLRDVSSTESYWTCTGVKALKDVVITTCSFSYDTYEAAFGNKAGVKGQSYVDLYIAQGLCEYDYDIGPSSFKRLSEACPIVEVISQTTIRIKINGVFVTRYQLNCQIAGYTEYGFSKMPIFLFGTDEAGRDMLKYVFEGLRTSLLLGICTFIFCFLFGLIWGSISGYFGGTVDLLMERFTDILSGVPWIVVMTLIIVHLGSNFLTFALALCMTGWIGTASLTRTQFYRFRDREYVLASRTLGASNMRLIFKHILPNALGTIITSSVLMIPSVIFSEATISYLGLGLKNLSSLGVILSRNQSQLLSNPYLLMFPSAIIALTMISFNLFGNGLRDAVNPSLKGEE